jgi:hypothetical protein
VLLKTINLVFKMQLTSSREVANSQLSHDG